jgi:hypothetical protein
VKKGGRVNRGYYIKGISGIQFMLPEACDRLIISDGYSVLNACDPAQAYGRIIPYNDDGRSWTCIPGTAVVQHSGVPVLIVEGYGERFRPVSQSKEEIAEAVKEFVNVAIRRGIMKLYSLSELTKEQFMVYKCRYSPYASVASIYLWPISYE